MDLVQPQHLLTHELLELLQLLLFSLLDILVQSEEVSLRVPKLLIFINLFWVLSAHQLFLSLNLFLETRALSFLHDFGSGPLSSGPAALAVPDSSGSAPTSGVGCALLAGDERYGQRPVHLSWRVGMQC